MPKIAIDKLEQQLNHAKDIFATFYRDHLHFLHDVATFFRTLFSKLLDFAHSSLATYNH